MLPSEKEIWNRINLGDSNAFEILFKMYYSNLCNYALDFVKNKAMAEEIVQESMIKLWENRTGLLVNVSLKAYLFKMVHNQCINFLKHDRTSANLKNRYIIEESRMNENYVLIDSEFTLSPFLRNEIEKEVEEAIAQLPDQCRTIFMMSRYDRLSYVEISSRLEVSVNTVKTQLRRAMEKLRVLLVDKLKHNFIQE